MPKDIKEDTKKKVVVVEEVLPESKTEAEQAEKEAPVVEEKNENAPQETAVDLEILPTEQSLDEPFEKTNYLWIIIPTALLIGALVGGLITYFSGISKLSTTASPTPEAEVQSTPETTASPVATSSSSLKRDELKLQVLNGSGVSGLASKAKTYLEELGYKDVQTGNASLSNLLESTLAIKDSKKDFSENLISDLSKKYKVNTETEVLPASSRYDAVITLGSK